MVQAGHTKYKSTAMEILQFVSYHAMLEWYDQAELIITHAGTGSIINGIKKGKVVIAVPRLKKYREHNDDHQLQITDALGSQGHLLPCIAIAELTSVLTKAKTFQPVPFLSGKSNLCTILNRFIEESS